MILLLLLLFIIDFVKASNVELISVTDGPFVIKLLFNGDSYTTDKVMLVKYAFPNVWFVTVPSDTINQNPAAICRSQSQQRIKWGPIGCSPPIETDNCFQTESQRNQRVEILRNSWRYSIKENNCFLEGGDGDPRLCVGPALLALTSNYSVTNPQIADFLRAQMVYVETLTDPLGMVPAVVEVKILMPTLRVITNCSSRWNQTFHSDTTYPIRLTDIIQVFTGTTQPSETVRIIRDDAGGFFVSLGDLEYTSPNYQFEFTQNSQFPVWTDQLPFNTTIPFSPNCSAEFAIFGPQLEWSLLDPTAVTPNNYTWNTIIREIYQTRVCNYGIGRLNHAGEEMLPFTIEGSKRGGDLLFVDPDTKLPLGVDADPDAHYRFNCDEFYPKDETFLDYGQNGRDYRNYHNRMSVDTEQCFSPFLVNELITNGVNPDEKFLQCQKLGASTYGAAQSYCARPITQLGSPLGCPIGMYYFDQRCYQKQSTSGCENDFEELLSLDPYLTNWLKFWFLYQTPRENVLYKVRQPKQNGVTLCQYFNGSSMSIVVDQSCLVQEVGGLPVRPICSKPAMLLKYQDQQISLKGAQIRRFGQKGPLPNGKEALCSCFDGWTGQRCQTATCPIPIRNSSYWEFFQKCYLGGGQCFNQEPRNCHCYFGYGPDASLLQSQPLLYQFREFPCLCPSHHQEGNPYFIINDVQYTIPFSNQQIPCGGSQQGVCDIAKNSSSSQGKCTCQQRLNILTGKYEYDYQGKSCACQAPIIPWKGLSKNGPIIQSFCNNRGQCMPFIQTYHDPQGLLWAFSNYGGCLCDPGWGGTSCTCPVPLNILANRPTRPLTFLDTVYYYKDLGESQYITYCNSTCESIILTNEIGKDDYISCNLENGLWWCNAGRQLVVLSDPTCEIQCYQENFTFSYCGKQDHVNQFSGRFYQVSAYRDEFKYQLQQPTPFATSGCSTMGCSCGPNWGGRLCNFAVSGYNTDGNKLFCGEEQILPSLFNPVQGSGSLGTSSCSCNPLSAVDTTGRIGVNWAKFTGNACQCVEVEGEMCAGHGRCIEPNFNYGWCQVDWETYQKDSLFTPFIKRTAIVDTRGTLTAVQDTYFYFYQDPTPPTPAPAPQISPTKFPTKNPTNNPTTKAPTTFGHILLFSLAGTNDGNMGNRATTTALCALSAPVGCRSTPMLISYSSSDTINLMPETYGFSSSARVVGPTWLEVAPTWSQFIDGPLTQTLSSAGVISTAFWTGYGLVNCNSWTSSSFASFGYYGSSSVTTSSWQASGYTYCSLSTYRICVCILDTPYPTTNPTLPP